MTNMTHDRYASPLTSRYASEEMAHNFSDDKKFSTWRQLWIHLARAEMELGIPDITPEILVDMERNVVRAMDREYITCKPLHRLTLTTKWLLRRKRSAVMM